MEESDSLGGNVISCKWTGSWNFKCNQSSTLKSSLCYLLFYKTAFFSVDYPFKKYLFNSSLKRQNISLSIHIFLTDINIWLKPPKNMSTTELDCPTLWLTFSIKDELFHSVWFRHYRFKWTFDHSREISN